ncbi:Pyridoxal phosphate-dependent transferase, major domain [Sesbania bispinosa]|nr:Pyridoxal phosphate-dependent transferase, major domain [Sesbania bispinosa]
MAAMQVLMKRTIATAKANHSNFQACKTHRFSSFGPSAATATHSVAPPPQLPPFDHQPQPYKGPSADEVLAKRKTFLGPSLFYYYQKPLNIVEGKMQYLFDENGKRYLDAFAGIVTVSCGHCHHEVLNAIIEQSKLLQHATTIYLHHTIEANELAMLMARLYTGNLGMISLRNAYHGGSSSTIGLTALNSWKYPIPEGEIHHVMNPDPYRGLFGADANSYARDVQDHIDYGTSGKVAGFIAETIQLEEQLNWHLGSHYWGFETQGVIPDIVTMAKGIGNGLPLGAVVTTPEIASVMAQKIQFNTFGGNPVCSAGGLAVLKVLDKEKRQAHCADVGSHMLERLRSLMQRHDIIGDVRGKGLMVGVELVTDRKEKTPAKAETAVLFENLELGVLVGKGGLHGNVFRIKPPMCFTKDDADFLVDALDYSMSKL